MKKIPWEKLASQELDKISDLFRNYPWEDREAYADFLSNMYYFLSQACRLLAASAAKCDNVTMDSFYHRFIEHAGEEKNHEKLVTVDLKNMKMDLKPCLPSMPPIWQTQFFLIQNKSPLALFGCVLYLENLSLHPTLGPYIYQKCKAAHGDKATTYLRVHVLEDYAHVDTLYKMLDTLPESHWEVVKEALLGTSSLYKNFFEELNAAHSKVKASKAS